MSAATSPDAPGRNIYLLYEVKKIELAYNTDDVADARSRKVGPSNSSPTPQLSIPQCSAPPPPAEIFREVWDYFHKENLNPLTSCPAMRSPVSEGVSVKCLLLENSPAKANGEGMKLGTVGVMGVGVCHIIHDKTV